MAHHTWSLVICMAHTQDANFSIYANSNHSTYAKVMEFQNEHIYDPWSWCRNQKRWKFQTQPFRHTLQLHLSGSNMGRQSSGFSRLTNPHLNYYFKSITDLMRKMYFPSLWPQCHWDPQIQTNLQNRKTLRQFLIPCLDEWVFQRRIVSTSEHQQDQINQSPIQSMDWLERCAMVAGNGALPRQAALRSMDTSAIG